MVGSLSVRTPSVVRPKAFSRRRYRSYLHRHINAIQVHRSKNGTKICHESPRGAKLISILRHISCNGALVHPQSLQNTYISYGYQDFGIASIEAARTAPPMTSLQMRTFVCPSRPSVAASRIINHLAGWHNVNSTCCHPFVRTQNVRVAWPSEIQHRWRTDKCQGNWNGKFNEL